MTNDYVRWGSVLAKRFPDYQSRGHDRAWELVKRQLAIGQSVSGVVVARAPFGAWIDIGVGFPGLLEITCIAGLTPQQYQAGERCQVGGNITAFIGGFRDDAHQIGLWQVRPWQGCTLPTNE